MSIFDASIEYFSIWPTNRTITLEDLGFYAIYSGNWKAQFISKTYHNQKRKKKIRGESNPLHIKKNEFRVWHSINFVKVYSRIIAYDNHFRVGVRFIYRTFLNVIHIHDSKLSDKLWLLCITNHNLPLSRWCHRENKICTYYKYINK